MTVARDDLWKDPCIQDRFLNTTMDNNVLFDYTKGDKNVSIFYRRKAIPNLNPSRSLDVISCDLEGHTGRTVHLIEDEAMGHVPKDHPGLNLCILGKVPVLQSALNEKAFGGQADFWEVLKIGFVLKYSVDQVCSGCVSSGRICGTNSSSPQNFTCYCPDKPHSCVCLSPGMPNARNPVVDIPRNFSKLSTAVVSHNLVNLLLILAIVPYILH